MIDQFLYEHINQMDDFWRRKSLNNSFKTQYNAYGHTVHFESNVNELLESAYLSAGRYSRANPIVNGDIAFTIIQDTQLDDKVVMDDFPDQLHYMAAHNTILLHGLPWVFASADLHTRTALAVVSSSLVERPVYLSRFVIDTITLNMLIHTGVGQLHASCLYRDGRVVMLSAPHNTGKSTTAYRMVRDGYQIISDGMTYLRHTDRGLCVMGYPVGELKLRKDVLEHFPELQMYGNSLLVREMTKMVYNLRQVIPDQVVENEVYPNKVQVCLLDRVTNGTSTAYPIHRKETLEGLWQDASHYDDLKVLSKNLETLWKMLGDASCYRLVLGHDDDEVMSLMDSL